MKLKAVRPPNLTAEQSKIFDMVEEILGELSATYLGNDVPIREVGAFVLATKALVKYFDSIEAATKKTGYERKNDGTTN